MSINRSLKDNSQDRLTQFNIVIVIFCDFKGSVREKMKGV